MLLMFGALEQWRFHLTSLHTQLRNPGPLA